MAQDLMGYDAMAREALRGVVREALRHVAEAGLPGAHHFYISFKTQHPGVDLDPILLKTYPDEMTIVLEHQFWDLEVEDDAFEVTLSFDKAPKYLRVPFDAVVQFHDPSVGFGLRFEPKDGPTGALPPPDVDTGGEAAAGDGGAEVVSLDAFRKKPS